MPTHIEYRTRGPRWNGTPYLSLASAQYELKALLPGRYRIEQRTVTTTEWEPLAAADREAPDDWRCECGDLNRGAEAFCFRCGACPHDDEPKETT